jgi:hypothetical protein
MGKSFVGFKEKGFWAHDSSLEIWLEALVKEITHMSPLPKWASLIKERWHIQAVAGFNGCINTDLDSLIANDEQKNILISLSERTIETLTSYGKLIPADTLDAMLADARKKEFHSRFTRSAPSENFIAVGRAFILLLKGEITTTASAPQTVG